MAPDADDHAFVLKLHTDGSCLRGRITEADSRAGRAVRSPEDVLVFLQPYLDRMGVVLSLRSRCVLWLSQVGRPSVSEAS
jgi:hypothetical protein